MILQGKCAACAACCAVCTWFHDLPEANDEEDPELPASTQETQATEDKHVFSIPSIAPSIRENISTNKYVRYVICCEYGNAKTMQTSLQEWPLGRAWNQTAIPKISKDHMVMSDAALDLNL